MAYAGDQDWDLYEILQSNACRRYYNSALGTSQQTNLQGKANIIRERLFILRRPRWPLPRSSDVSRAFSSLKLFLELAQLQFVVNL